MPARLGIINPPKNKRIQRTKTADQNYSKYGNIIAKKNNLIFILPLQK